MNSHTPTRVRLAATFFALATATVSFAQIPAEHAVVLTEQTVSPRSLLLDVDLKTGKFTPMGRFGLDGLPPLAVRHDPVNRDLIVAIRWPTGSRILRLKYSGTKLASQRVIADVSGQVTDMVLALSDQIFFTTGGHADYHQVTDHVETLDLEHLTNTIRAIAMGAETIVSGAATPTRVSLPDGN